MPSIKLFSEWIVQIRTSPLPSALDPAYFFISALYYSVFVFCSAD